MPGPAPKLTRRRRNAPERGEWKPASGVGWQHGDIPAAPDGLKPASVAAWTVWMQQWFAAHWTPGDLPALCQLIRLYDQVERGEFHRAAELRHWLDAYGVTPKGQQDRRWRSQADPPASAKPTRGDHARYSHLQVLEVNDDR